MRLLITGGAGFIGTRLLHSVVAKWGSVDAVVLDNLHPQVHGKQPAMPELPDGVRLVRGDVQDPSAWDALLTEFVPTIVVHLAAETGTGQSLRESARHAGVNVNGTAQLMDAFTRFGVYPSKVILASSRAVYGEGMWRSADGSTFYGQSRGPEQLRRGEWVPLGPEGQTGEPVGHDAAVVQARPSNVYAATKLAQEHLLAAWATAFGVSLTTLRLQNVYGAGQALNNPYTGVLTFLARQIASGEPLDIYEGGGIIRDFVHVSDVVAAIMAAMAPEFSTGQVPYDIGSGTPGDLLTFARQLVAASGKDVGIHVTSRFREGDVRAAFANIDRAIRDLDYRPMVSFEDGARELYAWAEQGA
jgi:dTDP-L-rhamnose 4-epimerase